MKALLLAAVTVASAPVGVEAATVSLKDVAASVTVLPENRSDVVVEVRAGKGPIAVPKVVRQGSDVQIQGVLPGKIDGCKGFEPGTTKGVVRFKNKPNAAVKDLPVIIVRTPLDVDVSVDGGVVGTIGPARSVRLRNARCGAWKAAGADQSFEARLQGMGDLTVGRTGSFALTLEGMGDVKAGPTGRLGARLSGMGDVKLEDLNGPAEIDLEGMGSVRIAHGRAPTFKASLSGMGDVRFDGVAERLDASVDGMGEVKVATVTGPVNKSVSGFGRVKVGK